LENQPLRWRDQYNLPEWKKKRREIIERAADECESCGRPFDFQYPERRPNVHHGYYHPGKRLWEYDDETLWALCGECHKLIQPVLYEIWLRVATINPKHLRAAANAIHQATNEFKPRYTDEQIARELAQIAKEEQEEYNLQYFDYSILLIESNELGPSLASRLMERVQRAFPGVEVNVEEAPGDPDCLSYVSGPDKEIREAIQRWVEDQKHNW
jgi:hypothetical protein